MFFFERLLSFAVYNFIDRAPELFHIETNSSITSKTDIFSLGGILYACCFGKGPFDDVYSRGDR
jgi:serine/threonine protein kinase